MSEDGWPSPGHGASQGAAPDSVEPGVRPISAGLRRHAVALTAPQSDALARLIIPGERRLVELFCLRNGTLGATLRGAGYAALRVYITPDGRVVENEESSEPDPFGQATEPFVLAREREHLHLGTMLPPPERERAPRRELRESSSAGEGEDPDR